MKTNPLGRKPTKRERADIGAALLQRRCILGNPLPLEDIAVWMGISRERVRQIETNALKKIRLRLCHSGPAGLKIWADLRAQYFERREPAKHCVRDLRLKYKNARNMVRG